MVNLTWEGKCKQIVPECEAVKVFENNHGQLWHGDNLDLMRKLPKSSINLIYIDPPFNTGRKDLPYKDKRTLDDYLSMMYERLKLMHSLLADDGSIYVHCDWRVNSALRLVLDEIFGSDNFKNELIWCYKSGGASDNEYAKKHDIIYFYNKSKRYVFNPSKEKSYMGIGYTTGNKNVKLYDDNDENGPYTLVNIKDWWIDVGMIATSKGRLYATQKPEALIERIIKASSNEGDLVADFFCGSGTTPAVAERLGRKWIACDIGQQAIDITIKRFDKSKERMAMNRKLFGIEDL